MLAILRRRESLLNNAKGELRRLIAEKRAAERRAAELERQRALAAQSVTAPAASPSAGGAPQSAPTYAPTGGGGGNSAAVGIAMRYLGVPYVWGGASPSGFDCSGFVQYVYAQYGIRLPRTADVQASVGYPVSKDELQPGDLVFFAGDYVNISHVGIYVGGGQMIHASSTYGIAYDSLSRDYRVAHYAGARRVS